MGFASAGTFDPEVLDDTLAEARDNARYAEPDEWAGLVAPDGVEPPELDLWRDDLASTPTEAKVQMALDLEAAIRGADPRIVGVRTAALQRGLGRGRRRVAAPAWPSASRGTSCSLGGDGAGPGGRRHPDRRRFDRRPGRGRPRPRRGRGRRRPAGHPPARGEAAADGQDHDRARAPPGGDAPGHRRRDAHRRPGAEGPLALRRPGGRGHRLAAADAGRRPDRPPLVRRRQPRRRGPGHPGQPADRRTACSQGFLHDGYTGRRSGTASTGSAVRGSRSTPAPGCQALVHDGRRPVARGPAGRRRPRPLRPVASPACTPASTPSAATSPSAPTA